MVRGEKDNIKYFGQSGSVWFEVFGQSRSMQLELCRAVKCLV